jgi:hypothetical protein
MKPSRKKKAQSSLEFVSIASFMFIVFISTFVTIEGRTSGLYKEKLYKSMDELSRIVDTEIRMAYSAPGDYEREFTLPNYLGNLNYSIKITDKAEITINSEDLDYVFFLDYNVSGNISKGENKITKIDNIINITYICLGGPGTDDDRCGIIDCSGWYNSSKDNYIWSCYNKTGITNNRCEDVNKCKEPNSAWCSYPNVPMNSIPTYSCEVCHNITNVACANNQYEGGTAHCQVAVGNLCGPSRYCSPVGMCD